MATIKRLWLHIDILLFIGIMMLLSVASVSYVFASRNIEIETEGQFVAVLGGDHMEDFCQQDWDEFTFKQKEKERVAKILYNDQEFLKKNGSRSYRNNNPGNLRFAGQIGAVGADKNGFAIFENFEDGRLAHMRQIKLDASRGQNLGDFVKKFAPSTANDPEAYAEFIARRFAGASLDTPLSALNVEKTQKVMQRIEGWIEPENPIVEKTVQKEIVISDECTEIADVKERIKCVRGS